MVRGGCIYIITNVNNTVLYTGITSDLTARIKQHKHKAYKRSFSARYNCHKLVYFETLLTINEAIEREKQIKAGSRKYKEKLIMKVYPVNDYEIATASFGSFAMTK